MGTGRKSARPATSRGVHQASPSTSATAAARKGTGRASAPQSSQTFATALLFRPQTTACATQTEAMHPCRRRSGTTRRSRGRVSSAERLGTGRGSAVHGCRRALTGLWLRGPAINPSRESASGVEGRATGRASVRPTAAEHHRAASPALDALIRTPFVVKRC
eukprot:3055680-Rhodomonas_salina.1